jgi:hypothetical protein
MNPSSGLGPGAWVMLILGCTILYGGLTTCLYIAHKNMGKEPVDDQDSEPENPEEV